MVMIILDDSVIYLFLVVTAYGFSVDFIQTNYVLNMVLSMFHVFG